MMNHDQARPVSELLCHWVNHTLEGTNPNLTGLHEGLRKALTFIGSNYTDPLTLDQLARQAHISPSHLSFLFRTVLGTSFKALLQLIRIERARLEIERRGLVRITDVALFVGFSDLSHFEKSFRRFVGETPRDYRRRVTAAAEPELLEPRTAEAHTSLPRLDMNFRNLGSMLEEQLL